MKPLLTLQQVTKLLNVSESTVRRMIKEGELKPIRVGGQLRFREEDLPGFKPELPETVRQGLGAISFITAQASIRCDEAPEMGEAARKALEEWDPDWSKKINPLDLASEVGELL